ncbi:FHA domain-containing protein [Agromyces sp. Marseille-Q5079]|uniref:FHA domain-containing protein n=1 Tax=Agromyces sp. Marseille-Q5079 TaxID=3439059 RepID=UPI003D9CA62F
MATYTADTDGVALAAVRGAAVLLVPVEAADALHDLWAQLADPDPTRAVLDRLTAGGLSATPSFALAVHAESGDEVRLVIRGPFTARVDFEVVDGAGVSTWVERVVTGRTMVLRATDAVTGDLPSLPIVEGVVPAASVTSIGAEVRAAVRPTPTESASARVAPLPAAPSEPVTPTTSVPVSVPVPLESLPPAMELLPPAVPAPTGIPTAQEPVDDATVVSSGFGARPDSEPGSEAGQEAASAGTEQTLIPPAENTAGDHDGMTIVGSDLQRLRAARAATPSAPAAGSTAEAEAKALGIRMPDGTLEPISHEVLLGRAPSTSRISGGRLPRVVAIGAGDQDISRNHVRIAVEGDTVVVTDLHSRNGTHVAQPGKAPVRLRAGEPTPVLTGTVVDLGGGWTLQVVAI